MREFINLNKNKLKYAAFISWLLFGFLNSIIVVFYLSDEKSITFWRGILLTAMYATISTLILLVAAIGLGGYEFTRKKRVFGQPEWNGVFAKHHFETIRIFQYSRWLLTEEVKTGYIKSFPVLADIKRDRSGYVLFMYFIEPASIGKQRYKELRQLLKKTNGSLEVGYVCKRLKRNINRSEADIDKELEDFADFLLQEGFVPKASGH